MTPSDLDSLAVALESGLPLNDPALRRTIKIAIDPRVPLSESLRRTNTLDDSAMAIIAAGERGGFLPKALRVLADDMREVGARRRRGLAALAYPAFLVVMASVILPAPIAVTKGVDAYFAAAAPGIIAVAVALALMFVVVPRLPASGLAKIPVFGSIVLDNARASVLELLGRQLAAGVPVSLALPASVRAGLPTWRDITLDSAVSLADALAPVTSDARVAFAEKTGTLDKQLAALAHEHRERAKRKFLMLAAVFGVLCFISIAVAIGGAVVSGTESYFQQIDRATQE